MRLPFYKKQYLKKKNSPYIQANTMFNDAFRIGLGIVGDRIFNIVQSVDWKLAGETEVLWENPPQWHSLYRISHLIWDRTWATVVGSRRHDSLSTSLFSAQSFDAKSYEWLAASLKKLQINEKHNI
jgi:hypothetical protein